MSDDPIGIIEQERKTGLAQLLLRQHVLERVEKNVAGDGSGTPCPERHP
ncbi:hypothetical protein ACVWWK_003927 [Bradyrhizobium sp. LB9.1b]